MLRFTLVSLPGTRRIALPRALRTRAGNARPKSARRSAAGRGVEPRLVRLEAQHGIGHGLRRLGIEEHAGGLAVVEAADRFPDAAAAIGYDGYAGCLGLERGDAEVLLGGEQERARLAKDLVASLVARMANKRDIGAGCGLDTIPFRSLADDHQLTSRQMREAAASTSIRL